MSELNMKDYIEFKKQSIRDKAKKLAKTPSLSILTDGKDARTNSYMKSKLKIGEELGFDVKKVIVDEFTLEDILSVLILNETPVICQLPIDRKLEEIYREKLSLLNDVDGFKNLFNESYDEVMPATPKGIMDYLFYKGYDFKGKNVVVLGRGMLVGKPLSLLLINEGASVTVLNSKSSKELREKVLKEADLVICATGVKGSAKSSELNDTKEVIVINVGTCFDKDGKLTTELDIDIDKPNVFYTPRIGGVGICTVLNLMDNVINSYM